MASPKTSSPAAAGRLAGWYVISLRPAGGHAPLRRAAARHGARTLALSPWRLHLHDDAGTRASLRQALQAPLVVFTSPAAVRAAAALQALPGDAGRHCIAVGEGTAAALRRAGAGAATAPSRMDSEGVLALPRLRQVRGVDIGLVTAPGGRERIAAELVGRGARILRADVYERVPMAPSARAVATLCALEGPLLLPLSSGQALQHVLGTLPAAATGVLMRARVVAASARLAALAAECGFSGIVAARSARPRDLLDAAAEAAIR